MISSEVKEKVAEKKITHWDTDVAVKDQVMEKGYLSVDDFYRFRVITDVANQLFFKKYKGYQQASIKITIDDRPAHVWFPTISTEDKKEHSQWLNYLNEDWSVIKEENIREDGKIVTNEVGELRAVFARMKDNFGKFSYRFIGNFELKTISEDRKSCEYHKVSDRLYIDYENEKLLMQAFI